MAQIIQMYNYYTVTSIKRLRSILIIFEVRGFLFSHDSVVRMLAHLLFLHSCEHLIIIGRHDHTTVIDHSWWGVAETRFWQAVSHGKAQPTLIQTHWCSRHRKKAVNLIVSCHSPGMFHASSSSNHLEQKRLSAWLPTSRSNWQS